MQQNGTITRLHSFRKTIGRGLWLGLALLLCLAVSAQLPAGIQVQQQQITLRVDDGQPLQGSMWTILRDHLPLGKVYDSRRRFTNMPGQFDPENNRGDKPVLPFETLEDAVDWLLADYHLQLQQNLDSLLLTTDTAWITRTDTALKLRYSVPAAWVIDGKYFFPDLTGHPDSSGRQVLDLATASIDGTVYNTLAFRHRHQMEQMLMLYMWPNEPYPTLDQAASAMSAALKSIGTKTLRSEDLTIGNRLWRKLYLMDYTGRQPAFITLHQGRLYVVQGGGYPARSTQAAIDAVATHVLEKLVLL